jgi:hypothetical protein
MGFQSADGLWLLFTLPVIVLFYLFKRKYADTPVSSHLLWNRVLKDMEANRPWQKLRNRLLMLLQLLAALLAVLAVAGLLFWREGRAGGSTIYVLDGSASMQAPGQKPETASTPDNRNTGSGMSYSRMEAAKAAILRHAEKDGASEKSLVLLSRQPVILLTREASSAKLKEALEEAEPVYGTAAYKETMTLAAAMAEEQGNAQVVFVTDGQWTDDTEALGLNTPVSILRIDGSHSASVGIVRFGVGATPNNGATGAVGSQVGPQPAGSYQGIASVRNWGAGESSAEAALYAEGRLIKVEKAVLAPGEEKHWTFTGLPPSAWYKLELRSEPDGIPSDNKAYAFPADGARKTVLLASGGNLFLEKALRLAQADVIKAQRTDAGYALPRSDVDLVVLDAVRDEDVASDGWTKLLEEKPVWSIRSGLKGAAVKQTADTLKVEPHPVMNYVRWEQVHVSEAVKPAELQGLEQVVSAGGLPLVLAGDEAGKRKLVFTFSLEHSDLALRPVFPILTQNVVDWLTADTGGVLGTGTAGDGIEVSLSPKTAAVRWDTVEAEEQAGLNSDGMPAGLQSAPRNHGLYRLVETDEAGKTVRSRLFAAVGDVREADLRHGPDTAFLTDGPSEQTDGTGVENRSPYPLTVWLIAAMLTVLLWEWEVFRRGHSV